MLVAFMESMGEPAVAEPATDAAPEPRTFEAFFQAEQRRLQRALYLMTGDIGEAEELMQDAFVAVWERWDRVSAMDEPVGYLYRTAMNRFRSARRRAVRAAKRAVGLGAAGDAFAAVDERDAVARGLAALTPRQRQAVVLTELLGFDAAAAAELMSIEAVTVRVLASQGRAALKEALGDG
jgi:RNA polymerase sigma-70 factor (ECF subfamily)